MASGKRKSSNIIAIVGPFGHKIVKQRKEKYFGLGKWAGCGKKEVCFPKNGGFNFKQRHFLAPEKLAFDRKRCFCQFLKLTLELRP